MPKALVAFALKEEFSPWRRRHAFRSVWLAGHSVHRTTLRTTEVLVALTGAGARQLGRFPALMNQVTPSLGIICGVAAGLRRQWRSGDLLAAVCVSEPKGEAKFASDPALIDIALQCGAKPAAVLVSLPRIAGTAAEKCRWATLADAADMESFTLMKQMHEHGIPSLALRAIVDPAEMAMPCDFEAALDARGQIRIARLLSQLVRRPQALPGFLRFAWLSLRATSALARFLDAFFERLDSWQGVPRTPPQTTGNAERHQL